MYSPETKLWQPYLQLSLSPALNQWRLRRLNDNAYGGVLPEIISYDRKTETLIYKQNTVLAELLNLLCPMHSVKRTYALRLLRMPLK